MDLFKKLKNLAKPLYYTPFHPQWLNNTGRKSLLTMLKKSNGMVLDIGCYNKWPKKHIPEDCNYIGLDYPETAENWYHSIPDIYADACHMPIKDSAIETILLFDVLEHIPDSDELFTEMYRILKPDGQILIQVPFLYPLHDEPHDYIRLTQYGFYSLAEKFNFILENCTPVGHPMTSSAILSNIALTKTTINFINNKNPAMIIILVIPLVILLQNLFARLIVAISREDPFMPFSYQLVLKKPS